MLKTVRHGFSLLRAGFFFAREGVLGLVDPEALPMPARVGLMLGRLIERRNAGDGSTRLSTAMARLGPSYVKLGQFMATRPDVVSQRLARDLSSLQDRMPPFSAAQARALVARALGQPVEELFVSFSPPVAAASIAQVHRATLDTPDGPRTVAVKVLRPGVARRFRRDLDTFYWVARTADRWRPALRRLKLPVVVDTLAHSVTREMDLRLEAAALAEMAENTVRDTGFRVPEIYWDYTARDVMTVEWIDGIPLNDIEGLRRAGHDLPRLAEHLIQSFLRHALRDGFFHADMHPGNLFVDAAGALVVIDFGITGRLTRQERRFLAEILYGFITRDYRRIAEVHFEAGYVPADQSVEDFAGALRSIGAQIFGRTADRISMARLLTQLFEVTELFNMETRPELLMLQKTMVVVEGVGRSLDPQLNIWSASEPLVRGWLEESIGPMGRIHEAAEHIKRFGHALVQLPGVIERVDRLAVRLEQNSMDGFTLSPASVEALGRAERRHSWLLYLAAWVIAMSMMAIVLRVFGY